MRTSYLSALFAIAGLLAILAGQASIAKSSPAVTPSTIERPELAKIMLHEERLNGVKIEDPYRWMESPNDETVVQWTAMQKAYAEQVLDEPRGQDEIRAALIAEFEAAPTLEDIIPIPDGLIFDRWLPSGHEYRLLGPGGEERTLFKSDLLKKAGRSARVRAVIPSWDGKYIAVVATGSGDEAAQVSVIEIETGKLLPDLIPDLLTTTSGARYRVAWLPDSSSFIYPRLAKGARSGPAVTRLARGRQYLHRIGTPVTADVPVFGFGVSRAVAFAEDDLPAVIVTAPGLNWVWQRHHE